MDNIDLEKEIKWKFLELDKKLSLQEKEAFHFVSISNIVRYIFKDELSTKIEKSQLKKVNLLRNKKLLLEYLSLILDKKVSTDDTVFLFKNYVKPIGEFMGSNYGFSFAGGKIKYLYFLIYISFGAFIDLIIWAILKNPVYIFTLLLLIYSVIKVFIKSQKGKLYGPNF